MNNNTKKLKDRLWKAANDLRANSPLRLNEFSEPVLGLIFLKFADVKHENITREIITERAERKKEKTTLRERPISPEDYRARGALFVPKKARFSYLISLAEGSDMGKAVNDAMKEIEKSNKDLSGILPQNYNKLDNETIIALLKNFNQIPDDIEGDAFGSIYEYFLGKFALSDGTRGGEFFTPTSIVKLMVEILEPYYGRIYDPACGSGGMFVQSHKFVEKHLENGKKKKASERIAIYGQEKTENTVRIAKMNIAIHGLSGDIKQGNAYYEDLHKSYKKFDFTLANPPFNVSGIDRERIKDDSRFSYGIPKSDNGNYLWIQIFLNSLNEKGRAGFVMANSASDAGHTEKSIREKIIKDNIVDVMVAVGTNMFHNVTLPVTLWFFDKGKKGTDREDKILFIDAREIYRQIDRRHRDFTDEQIDKIANIVRSYRKEEGAEEYKDEKGLCKVANLEEVEKNGWSLNPGRYVGVTENGDDGNEEEFGEKINKLHKEFKDLTGESHKLEKKIFDNLKKLEL